MHRSQEDLIAMLPTRAARLLRTGEHDGRYADNRAVLMAVIRGAAQVDMRLDDLMRLIRNEAHAGAVWWQRHPDRSWATDHVRWCFVRSRRQTVAARDAFRARTEARLWLAAHACWPGREGDAQYRAFVALITAAHDRGAGEFVASERVLSLYAILSRTTLRKALDQLAADKIVRQTKHGEGGSSQYELHQAGFERLWARTPEGVERHPDERRILKQQMRVPNASFPVQDAGRAEVAPSEHSSTSQSPPWTKDQEGCSHGATSALSDGAGAGWPFVNGETAERGWMPCHPAFGYRRLDQRVFWLTRPRDPVQASWIAQVTGLSSRTARDRLAKLVAAGLVLEADGGFVRCPVMVGMLDQIAADNGGYDALRRIVALAQKEQLDYRGDPYILDKLRDLAARNAGAQVEAEAATEVLVENTDEAIVSKIDEVVEAVQPEVSDEDAAEEVEVFVWDEQSAAAIFDGINFDQPEAPGESWQERADRLRIAPPRDVA